MDLKVETVVVELIPPEYQVVPLFLFVVPLSDQQVKEPTAALVSLVSEYQARVVKEAVESSLED